MTDPTPGPTTGPIPFGPPPPPSAPDLDPSPVATAPEAATGEGSTTDQRPAHALVEGAPEQSTEEAPRPHRHSRGFGIVGKFAQEDDDQ